MQKKRIGTAFRFLPAQNARKKQVPTLDETPQTRASSLFAAGEEGYLLRDRPRDESWLSRIFVHFGVPLHTGAAKTTLFG